MIEVVTGSEWPTTATNDPSYYPQQTRSTMFKDQFSDMLATIKQFRCHLLIMLVLLIMRGMIPLPAAEQSASLPKDAEKYVADYNDDVEKARKDLVKKLERVLVKYTKAGNLDEANAINAKITEMNSVSGAVNLLGGPTGELPGGNVISQTEADMIKASMPSLTERDWDTLGGLMVAIDVADDLKVTPIQVSSGDSFLLVPHPTDKWASVSWKGNPAQSNWAGSTANGGALLWNVTGTRGNGSNNLIVSGVGKLGFYANWGGPAGRQGTMHVKILKIK